jgi:WD40 repeat protein
MTIVVSDVIKGQVLQTLRGHTARILAVAFDSKHIISLSSDGEARYWFWGRQGSGDIGGAAAGKAVFKCS